MIQKFIQKKQNSAQAMQSSIPLGFAAKSLGIIRNVVIVIGIGYTFETDVYFLSISVIGFYLLFGNVIDMLGIPVLVTQKEKNEQELINQIWTFSISLAVILSLLNFISADILSAIAGKGYDAKEIEKLSSVIRSLTPYIFFSYFFNQIGTIFRYYRNFNAYYFGNLVFAVVYLIYIIIVIFIFNLKTAEVLSFGLAVGMFFASLYILKYKHFKLIFSFKYLFKIKYLLKEFAILSVFQSCFWIYSLIDKTFATYLPKSYLTGYSFAFLIIISLKGIINFEHIFITSISELKEKPSKLFDYIIFLFGFILPITLFFYLYSTPIVHLLINYGKITTENINITVMSLRMLSISLPLLIIWPTLFRIIYVQKIQMKLSFIFILISLFINYFSNRYFIFYTSLGVVGLAYSLFISFFILVFSNLIVMIKKFKFKSKKLIGKGETWQLISIILIIAIHLFFNSYIGLVLAGIVLTTFSYLYIRIKDLL